MKVYTTTQKEELIEFLRERFSIEPIEIKRFRIRDIEAGALYIGCFKISVVWKLLKKGAYVGFISEDDNGTLQLYPVTVDIVRNIDNLSDFGNE